MPIEFVNRNDGAFSHLWRGGGRIPAGSCFLFNLTNNFSVPALFYLSVELCRPVLYQKKLFR